MTPDTRFRYSISTRWTLRAVMTAIILIVSFAGLAGGAGAGPPGPRCDKSRAKTAFISGIEQYGRQQWEAAIPGLLNAATLCPVPVEDHWTISVFDFGEYDYVPFYYLGKMLLQNKRRGKLF